MMTTLYDLVSDNPLPFSVPVDAKLGGGPAKASTSDLGDQTSRALRSVHAYSACWLSRKLTIPIEKEPLQAGF